MLDDDLLWPEDLDGIPGGPFSEKEVAVAAARLRAEVGWHIAPSREETIELDVMPGETTLRLPTRHLTAVDEVRDLDRDTVIDPERYRVSAARGRIRRRSGFWPSGYSRVSVTFTHGFEACPPDLYEVVAHYARSVRRDPSVQATRVDDGSVSFFSAATTAAAGPTDVLARYRIPEWSGMA